MIYLYVSNVYTVILDHWWETIFKMCILFCYNLEIKRQSFLISPYPVPIALAKNVLLWKMAVLMGTMVVVVGKLDEDCGMRRKASKKNHLAPGPKTGL